MMPKKIVFMVLITLSVLLLTGFGKDSVELHHSKQKLIDLNKAIDIAKAGTSLEEADDTDNAEESSDTADDDGPSQSDMSAQEAGVVSDSVNSDNADAVIEIINETIIYKGFEYTEEQFERAIDNKSADDHRYLLIDNYAEVHVYKAVERLLIDRKIAFTKETKD